MGKRPARCYRQMKSKEEASEDRRMKSKEEASEEKKPPERYGLVKWTEDWVDGTCLSKKIMILRIPETGSEKDLKDPDEVSLTVKSEDSLKDDEKKQEDDEKKQEKVGMYKNLRISETESSGEKDSKDPDEGSLTVKSEKKSDDEKMQKKVGMYKMKEYWKNGVNLIKIIKYLQIGVTVETESGIIGEKDSKDPDEGSVKSENTVGQTSKEPDQNVLPPQIFRWIKGELTEKEHWKDGELIKETIVSSPIGVELGALERTAKKEWIEMVNLLAAKVKAAEPESQMNSNEPPEQGEQL